MYYPQRAVFMHIDYTKNQYSGTDYIQKYADSVDGMPVGQYTVTSDLHYKYGASKMVNFHVIRGIS